MKFASGLQIIFSASDLTRAEKDVKDHFQIEDDDFEKKKISEKFTKVRLSSLRANGAVRERNTHSIDSPVGCNCICAAQLTKCGCLEEQ